MKKILPVCTVKKHLPRGYPSLRPFLTPEAAPHSTGRNPSTRGIPSPEATPPPKTASHNEATPPALALPESTSPNTRYLPTATSRDIISPHPEDSPHPTPRGFPSHHTRDIPHTAPFTPRLPQGSTEFPPNEHILDRSPNPLHNLTDHSQTPCTLDQPCPDRDGQIAQALTSHMQPHRDHTATRQQLTNNNLHAKLCYRYPIPSPVPLTSHNLHSRPPYQHKQVHLTTPDLLHYQDATSLPFLPSVTAFHHSPPPC